MDKIEVKPLEKSGQISVTLSDLWLILGNYHIDFVVRNKKLQDISPVIKKNIQIISKTSRPGVVAVDVNWGL